MSIFAALFAEIDRAWPDDGIKQPLHIIGSGALMLQTPYQRGTKDGDVYQATALSADAARRLAAIAGRGTPLATRHRLFIEIVGNGFPCLPQVPRWHPLDELNVALQRFELHVLDVVDVVVSKLAPFRAQDVEDIAAMIERDLVPHARLVERFGLAVDQWAYDARASELHRIIENLHQIERDYLDADETEIELPAWV